MMNLFASLTSNRHSRYYYFIIMKKIHLNPTPFRLEIWISRNEEEHQTTKQATLLDSNMQPKQHKTTKTEAPKG